MSDKVLQDFYCNDCDGFIAVKLNMAINKAVVVRCPKCDREHPRRIKDGKIYEGGDGSGNREVIRPTMAAYSKKPHTDGIKKHARDGVEFKRHPATDDIIKQSWIDRFGDRLFGS